MKCMKCDKNKSIVSEIVICDSIKNNIIKNA